MLDIAIVGSGLAGLSLATLLQQESRSLGIFEANHRPGGRILSLPALDENTKQTSTPDPVFKFDLGPAWVWPEAQPRIASFMAQYNIDTFPQWAIGKSLYQSEREKTPQVYSDNPYVAARRIHGGAYRLVEVLEAQLPPGLVKFDHRLVEVVRQQDHIELTFRHDNSVVIISARQVVITIPPRLLVDSVAFTPALEPRLVSAMRNTITWMAGHAKAIIRYGHAFWRDAGFSGNAIASYQGAALAEIFDCCSADGEQAALAGFFALPAALRQRYHADLSALMMEQLVRLFGKEAAMPVEIIIQDWFNEPLTSTPDDEFPPAYHPQYGHRWLQLDHWNDKLYFSGTETATEFGGYLEGALESSERVSKLLLL